jgi:hypothetical protein
MRRVPRSGFTLASDREKDGVELFLGHFDADPTSAKVEVIVKVS